jgi:hypothetical protein
MNKEQFISGAKFRHRTQMLTSYQYEPLSFAGSTGGYLWQTIPGSCRRNLIASISDIGEKSASISLIVLGQFINITFPYSEFELI